MARLPLAFSLLCLLPSAARADDPIDSVMYRSPELPTPRVVRTFSDKLPGLWTEALGRPEADFRREAALAIARAHEHGMGGLAATVPALTRELDRPDQHPSVALAAARALVALDAKDAAPSLFKLASAGDNDAAEVIEPALARWGYGPAKDEWLKRLNQTPPRRPVVRAMQGLAVVREERAAPRLRELVLSAETPPAVRLEAAKALGAVRTSGSEADADKLAADTSPKGIVGRLSAAWVLRHHGGDEAVRRLQALARDAEPSVVAVALARLVEIDPTVAEPVLTPALASADANVRTLGVEVLARRPSEKHVALLGELLADPHPDARSRARVALREQAKAAELLAPVLKAGERAIGGTDWRGKEQGAVLLAHLGHKPASGRLVELLRDERPEVAVAAAWGLRVLAVPDTFPKALDHFRQFVKAPSPEWRDRQLSHVAQLLGEGKYAPADAPLRAIVPPGSPAGFETRAAACWALGLLHEGKPVPELASLFARRLAAVNPFDIEDDRVRRMCAVSLGRMRAKDQLPALREFYSAGKPSLDAVNNACGWAVEQITGEKVPPPGVISAPQLGWFLMPVE